MGDESKDGAKSSVWPAISSAPETEPERTASVCSTGCAGACARAGAPPRPLKPPPLAWSEARKMASVRTSDGTERTRIGLQPPRANAASNRHRLHNEHSLVSLADHPHVKQVSGLQRAKDGRCTQFRASVCEALAVRMIRVRPKRRPRRENRANRSSHRC